MHPCSDSAVPRAFIKPRRYQVPEADTRAASSSWPPLLFFLFRSLHGRQLAAIAMTLILSWRPSGLSIHGRRHKRRRARPRTERNRRAQGWAKENRERSSPRSSHCSPPSTNVAPDKPTRLIRSCFREEQCVYAACKLICSKLGSLAGIDDVFVITTIERGGIFLFYFL